jgi:hypothetical protein
MIVRNCCSEISNLHKPGNRTFLRLPPLFSHFVK